MVVREVCPPWRSPRDTKHGHTRHGQHHHQWKACGRQCAAEAVDQGMVHAQRMRIAQLWCERVSRRGICRAVGVRLTWLVHRRVECLPTCPNHLHVPLSARPTAVVVSRLEAEADKRWSWVQKKANTQGIWIAMDATTRHIMAFHGGHRRRESGKELWATMPPVSRAQATFHARLLAHLGARWQWSVMRGRVIPQVPPTTPWPPGGPPCPNPR